MSMKQKELLDVIGETHDALCNAHDIDDLDKPILDLEHLRTKIQQEGIEN